MMNDRHALCRWRISDLDNSKILEMTTVLFLLFVLAEIVGGLLSNSLSLIEDSIATMLDVVTYILNLYGENLKKTNPHLTRRDRLLVQVIIPFISVLVLLCLCFYFMIDAIHVLKDPPEENDVDVSYMYVFSIANAVVDVCTIIPFVARGMDVFMDSEEVYSDHEDQVDSLISTDVEINSSSSSPMRLNGDRVIVSEHDKLHPAKNLVMITAFSHIGGDALRTVSMLLAAIYSTMMGVHPDICDAWAAMVSCVTIMLACSLMLIEIMHEAATIEIEGERRSIKKPTRTGSLRIQPRTTVELGAYGPYDMDDSEH